MNMKNLLTIFIVLGIFGTCVSAASAADVHEVNGINMTDEMFAWYFDCQLVNETIVSDEIMNNTIKPVENSSVLQISNCTISKHLFPHINGVQINSDPDDFGDLEVPGQVSTGVKVGLSTVITLMSTISFTEISAIAATIVAFPEILPVVIAAGAGAGHGLIAGVIISIKEFWD